MRAFFLALITLLLLPLTALAQSADRPNTILVLDGSGSMWGQIDGVNKIVIAREVIADLLADMADDVSLGLTVYGHRERGSCTDIETIVPPAPGTQSRILEAVNSINPRGRTPMTDAVIAAAQSLRSTEEAATVILVSDGIENCNPDPCAIAAELEATGVDFTAHVIGFDVASEPEARAQMQCIADNTGGQFLTADNATELSQALEQVVAIMPTPMRIEAGIPPAFNPPTRPITWTLLGADGDVISQGTPGPAIDVSLFPGLYIAQATRQEPTGPQTYQTSFTVMEGQTDLIIVAMPPIVETSQITFTARVQPDMSVPASALAWTLFDANNTALLGPVVAPGGNVALLPGDYRLEVERANTGTRHEARFTVAPNTPQDIVVPLPALSVEIDFVARIGSVSGVTITDPVIWDVEPLETNPVTTNPATFLMSRGAYRVTAYWTAQEIEESVDFVVVDQPREIIVVFPEPVASATLTAPAQAPMGSMIQVGWMGPENDGDVLSFGPIGDGVTRHVNPHYVDPANNPMMMQMPAEAGLFEIRYTDVSTQQIIARVPITSTPVTATLTVPDEVTIGSAFTVPWTGPDYPGDMVLITAPDASTHGYSASRHATSDGPVAELTAPTEPGIYEVRYRMGQDGVILARAQLNVVEEIASLTGPTSAVAGSTIELGWTGPDNDGDFIGITSVDREGYHRFANTTRTSEGNPLDLLMPTVPGDYVLEYVLAEGRTRIVAVPFTVTPAEATLTAPATATVGDTLEIGWTGPDYAGDFIGITPAGGEGYHRFSNTTRTSDGAPLDLLMPTEPGEYVIEYVFGQDRRRLTSVPITVTEVAATLTAPASAVAGSVLSVAWTGPDYAGDFIAVTPQGAEGYHRFDGTTRTSEGSPLNLQVPAQPGEYMLEYVIGQDRSSVVTQPLTVTELGATLTGPTSAISGSSVEFGWTGPGYDSDFIAITPAGGEGYHRFAETARVNLGNPLRLQMPTEPGSYVVEYVLGQDRSALTTVPMTVTEASATVTAPATAVAGSTIEVAWTGPNYDRDFIGIGRVDAEGGARWENYARTSEGPILQLVTPPAPGDYVIRYFIDQDRVALAEVAITLTESEASITAPATAVAGSTIEVAWTGPNYNRDFIGLGAVGATGGSQWEEYTRTEGGSPLQLLTPPRAGTFLIRYFVDQDRLVLAEAEITLTAPTATITAPRTAAVGSTIELGWTGPDYNRDFVGIGRVGATGGEQWVGYTRTQSGSPMRLLMPTEPGEYVIRYFTDHDRVVLAEVPMTLTDVPSTLTAPSTAQAGGTLQVEWTGPNYDRDFIALGPVGASGGEQWQTYTRTSTGSPLTIAVPDAPGSYVLQYFMDQSRRSIATLPITVQ